MTNKSNNSHKKGPALTREAAERVLKKLGIDMAGPDHPIYSEPVTVSFINKPKKSEKGTKLDSKD